MRAPLNFPFPQNSLSLSIFIFVLTACELGSRPGAAGSVAPPYTFQTWDGQTMTQEDFARQPVVLNFWATWCVPCRAEMPAFQSLYTRYRDLGVTVVGIAVQDDPVLARKFVGDLGITYPTGGDLRNESFQRFRVVGLPTTLFIDKDGKIVRRWDGALDEHQLTAMVAELMATR